MSSKGLQRAGPGRLAWRSKAHGPTRGGPLSPLIGQRAGPADPLVNLRLVAQPVGPQAGRARWVLGEKKILLSFEGKGLWIHKQRASHQLS